MIIATTATTTMAVAATDVLGLIVAGVALVVAVLAAVFTKRQADQTKRQADLAEQGNETARKALAVAEAARDLNHRDWHRQAQPAVTVRLGHNTSTPRGYELLVETDKDLDSCTLELADGTPLTKVTGLSVGLTETIFNHNPQVVLRNLKAGTPARPALWLAPSAEGVTVSLRCTVTIGDEVWSPIVRDVQIVGRPRIITASSD